MQYRSTVLLSMLLLLSPVIAAAQPGRLILPDFSALTKKASNAVDINLDPSLLSLAAGALSANPNANNPAVKDLINGLQGIYVHSYMFDQDGAYSKADVDSVRSQLVAPWAPLVSTHDRNKQSDVDIYVRRNGERTEGMAIIVAEPRKLTIVNIVGPIDLSKLAQLQGNFGVPRIGAPKIDVPKIDVPAPNPDAKDYSPR